ncbi:hypothetical protein [Nocardioides dongxiaopingii]|uniref:hypothetical protein n=1 Tax=Nocardioides dongxiaopingii TaxID=2576036 RepID=UPI0010C765C2|nr:hypothetical protein [Nocardioides dongxiaopingii]
MPVTAGRYAAVTSTLALVVALGGTGYAAAKIGTKDIKNNAVTTSKVKNDTLTGQDVRESALGTVPGAARVNGQSVTKVRYKVPPSTPARVIYNQGGLSLTATCSAVYDTRLVARTTRSGGFISTFVYGDSSPLPDDPIEDDIEDAAFDPSDAFDLIPAAANANVNLVLFDYVGDDGTVVSGRLVADETNNCQLHGHVVAG